MRTPIKHTLLGLLFVAGCGTATLAQSTPDGGEPPDSGAASDDAGSGSGGAHDAGAIHDAGHDASAPDDAGDTPHDASAPIADASIDAPATPGTPALGAHALAFYKVGENAGVLSTPPIAVQPSGSVVIVGVARGNAANFTSTPSDNKGNAPYTLQGMMHPYAHPNEDSGTAVYGYVNAKGGSGFQVSDLNGHQSNNQLDEITMAVVEVVDATRIADVAWNEATQAGPIMSAGVTTTGPATLISFWWGEDTSLQSVAAGNGFTVIDSQLLATNSIQGAVAVKQVSSAGTYDVTWTSMPAQGAQVWLIAVQ